MSLSGQAVTVHALYKHIVFEPIERNLWSVADHSSIIPVLKKRLILGTELIGISGAEHQFHQGGTYNLTSLADMNELDWTSLTYARSVTITEGSTFNHTAICLELKIISYTISIQRVVIRNWANSCENIRKCTNMFVNRFFQIGEI